MANDFPNTMCYGLNLFKIPDTEDFPHIPPNLHFDKANILQGIDHPNESFDFIHQRNMVHLYHGDDISFIIGEMMRLLKPGGYIEFVEVIKRKYPSHIITHDHHSVFISQT